MTAQSGHRECFISSTDKDGAQYNKMCVSGIHFWLRELKWLIYTPETTCNNPCIVQRTLTIPEYSKHPHFKAKQNIKLRTRIDPIMFL
jgi:hypothetical protein